MVLSKHTFALREWTVEHRSAGWFYWRTYGEKVPKGPYTSEFSVCLMIARELRKELLKRNPAPVDAAA
jgi:hypothetical protein